MVEKRSGCAINKVNRSENTFAPKLDRQIGMKPKGTSDIQNVTMFALHRTILLRSIGTGCLEDGANRGEIFL